MPPGAIPFPFGKCRVCCDRATGVHYGVATCEGCKGFFKRSTLRGDKYKCFFGGQCEINPQNRNRCKSCRFRRCLESGMAVDAVKMGRIPKLEKERALAEARLSYPEGKLPMQNDGVTSTTPFISLDNLEQQVSRDQKDQKLSQKIQNDKIPQGANVPDEVLPNGYHREREMDAMSEHDAHHDVHHLLNSQNLSSRPQLDLSLRVPTSMQMCQSWVNSQSFHGERNGNPLSPAPLPHHHMTNEPYTNDNYFMRVSGARNLHSYDDMRGREEEGFHMRYRDFHQNGRGVNGYPSNCMETHTGHYHAENHQTFAHSHSHPAVGTSYGNKSLNLNAPNMILKNEPLEREACHMQAGPVTWNDSVHGPVPRAEPGVSKQEDRAGGYTSVSDHRRRSMESRSEETMQCDPSSSQKIGYSPSVMKVLINKFMEANSTGEEEDGMGIQQKGDLGMNREEGKDVQGSTGQEADVKEYRSKDIDQEVEEPVFVPSTKSFRKGKYDKTWQGTLDPKYTIEEKMIETELPSQYDAEVSRSASKNSTFGDSNSISSCQDEVIWDDYKFLKTMIPDPIFGNLPLHVNNLESMRKLGQEGILEKLVEFPIDTIMSIAEKLKGAMPESKAIDRNCAVMERESELIVQSTLVRLRQVSKVLLEPLWQKRCYVRQYLQGSINVRFTTCKPEEMESIWASLMKSVVHFNEIIIGFCKNVPGCSKLDSKLQEFLIERVYFDIWMLNSSEFIIDGLSYMVMPNGQFYSKETMMHILKEDRVKELFDVAETLNSFHLTDLELLLLCVVQLTCPDDIPREKQLDLEPLHTLNLHYLDILANVVAHNYGQQCKVKLMKIFQFLPKLSRLTNKLRKQVTSYDVELPDEDKFEKIFQESDKAE